MAVFVGGYVGVGIGVDWVVIGVLYDGYCVVVVEVFVY